MPILTTIITLTILNYHACAAILDLMMSNYSTIIIRQVAREAVIAWWTLTTLLSLATATCPQVCRCRHNDMVVDCSGRQLRALPGGLQPNITQLRLSNNNFVTLGK